MKALRVALLVFVSVLFPIVLLVLEDPPRPLPSLAGGAASQAPGSAPEPRTSPQPQGSFPVPWGGITPTYASPSVLANANANHLPFGSQVWVTNQGPWTFLPCPSLCDGTDTCRAAAASSGNCWLRSIQGIPGAQAQANWYVDADAGSNSATCIAPGASACADLPEVFRRIGNQPVTTTPTVVVTGDFPSASPTLTANVGAAFQTVNVIGTRIYTDPDGGSLGTWIVTAYAPWDGTTHQEGTATVAPLTDGGAGLPPTFLTANGNWLEDQTGANVGLGVPVFAQVDAGTFLTSGGAVVGSFTNGEPQVGDVLRAYRLPKISTDPGTLFSVYGEGWLFANLQLGNRAHTVAVQSYGVGVEFDACLVVGSDIYSGWLFAYGSAFTSGLRVYSRAQFLTSNQVDLLETAEDSSVQLSGWNLAGNPSGVGGIMVGGSGKGGGKLQLDTGPNAIVNVGTQGTLFVNPGGLAQIDAPFWVRNSGPSNPAIQVTVGSLGVVYKVPPVAVGVSSTTPWLLGGTAFATLPQTNNGVAIQPY